MEENILKSLVMENIGQGRISWEFFRENKKSSDDKWRRKQASDIRQLTKEMKKFLGWKWKVSEWNELELKEIFKEKMRAKGILSSSTGFLSSILL